jgi:hypothetical protein
MKPLQTSPKGRLRQSKIVEDLPLLRPNRMGRFQQRFKPEDLPDQQTTFSFRVKGMKCKSHLTFIFLSLFIFRKQSLKNFSVMKKKIFIVAAVLLSSRLLGQQPDRAIVDSLSSLQNNVELTGVVVTATKFPHKQSETGKE